MDNKNKSKNKNKIGEYLRVSAIHEIYYEVVGNRTSTKNVIFVLHGGPGWIFRSRFYMSLASPRKFQFVVIHQRGTGYSRPKHTIKENNTKALVQDIEKVRLHLKLDRIIVFGVSWGATLAVIYGIEYPKHVRGIVLCGVSLFGNFGKKYMRFFSLKGNNISEPTLPSMAPELYEKFRDDTFPTKSSKSKRIKTKMSKTSETRMFATILKGLRSKNKQIKERACKRFEHETELFKYMQFPQYEGPGIAKNEAIIFHPTNEDRLFLCLMEAYFYYNHAFVSREYFIQNIKKKLRNIPGFIIHGRLDLICAPVNAYILHREWGSKSTLKINNMSGHDPMDRTNAIELRKAFKSLIYSSSRTKKG